MSKVVSYFKGVVGLVAVVILAILAAVFLFLFNMVYASIIMVLGIIAILLVPYYFGKKYEKEKPETYEIENIKE
jgi:uncharacterized membrane protein